MIAAAPLEALKDVPLLEGLSDELIADFAGHAQFTIADFEASGALRRERGHVAYLNREALMDLAMDA